MNSYEDDYDNDQDVIIDMIMINMMKINVRLFSYTGL